MRLPSIPLRAHRIWTLLTPSERRSALALIGLTFLGMVLETLGVGLVMPAIILLTQSDIAQNYPAFKPFVQSIGNPSQTTLVVCGLLVLVGVYLIKTLFLAFLAWRQTRFAFRLQAQLSERLFAVYLSQPYTFHLQRNSAQLLRNVINEISVFTLNGMLPGMLLLTEAMVLVGLSVLLLVIEPLGAVLSVGVLGVVAWAFHRLTQGRITQWGGERQYHEGLRIQHLQQGLGGVKEVKVLGREAGFLDQYRIHNVKSARAVEFQISLQQFPRLLLELLAVTGLAIVVISMLAQNRPLELVLPTLTLFTAVAFRLMPSANRALSSIQILRYARPVIDMLHTELNLATPTHPSPRRPMTHPPTMLELNDVTYSYPNSATPALKRISLSIRLGESVGFIGPSGAGKSTLVDILLGLLTPDDGTVRLDGVIVQGILRSWQDQIGYVPQSIFLTDDTLRRNVAFGLPSDEVDDTAVLRAIRAAQLEELVASLPNGLDTLVGERGIRLSGGQRQRIGIARALYHDPTVLVLDEATSSLDAITEYEVMQGVRALRRGKMIIIVAHRISTVEHCDRLFRLEAGCVVEAGAPSVMVSS